MSSLSCYDTKSYGWQSCYTASNNYQFNYPALMSDSRIWSSWQPDAVINKRIQEQNGIQSNWQYRQYLQSNANSIISMNSEQACTAMGINPHYYENKTPSSNVPYTFRGTFDTSAPGFGYCNSDLKSPYLSREQLNARLISPRIYPQNQ